MIETIYQKKARLDKEFTEYLERCTKENEENGD